MLKPCHHCSCSGIKIEYTGPSNVRDGFPAVACKACRGRGWVEEDELITVPRKFVKDEYWEQLK